MYFSFSLRKGLISALPYKEYMWPRTMLVEPINALSSEWYWHFCKVILITKVKKDGQLRLCSDYKHLFNWSNWSHFTLQSKIKQFLYITSIYYQLQRNSEKQDVYISLCVLPMGMQSHTFIAFYRVFKCNFAICK